MFADEGSQYLITTVTRVTRVGQVAQGTVGINGARCWLQHQPLVGMCVCVYALNCPLTSRLRGKCVCPMISHLTQPSPPWPRHNPHSHSPGRRRRVDTPGAQRLCHSSAVCTSLRSHSLLTADAHAQHKLDSLPSLWGRYFSVNNIWYDIAQRQNNKPHDSSVQITDPRVTSQDCKPKKRLHTNHKA